MIPSNRWHRLFLVLIVGSAVVAHAAQETRNRAESAERMVRDVLAVVYPEIDLSTAKLSVNVSDVGNEEDYEVGALILPSASGGGNQLHLMISIRKGQLASLLAEGPYVKQQELDSAKAEVVTKRLRKSKDIVPLLSRRGATLLPPRVIYGARLSRTLDKFFPGIVLSKGEFQLFVTEEPPQPVLSWRFSSEPRKSTSKEEVHVQIEPFTGKVISIQVPSRFP